MKNFKTLAAIASSLGRIPKGAIVALPKDEASRYMRFLEPTNATVTDERFIGSVNADVNATATLSGDVAETITTESNDDSQDDAPETDGLDDMNVADLKEKAASLELPVSGNKKALIERIRLALAATEGDDDADDSTDDE